MRNVCLILVALTIAQTAADAATDAATDVSGLHSKSNQKHSPRTSRKNKIAVGLASKKVVDAHAVSWTKNYAAAHAAFQANDFAKAERYAKKSVRDARHMKENDPRVLQSAEELGQILLRQRKFDEARPYFMQVLKIKEAKFGKDADELIQPLNDVVRVTCAGGACYDTIPYLKRLLVIRKRVDPKSRDIPITLLLIGEAYEKRESYPEAMDYFKQATLAEKQRVGNGPMVATLARNIERVRHKMAVCAK